MAEILLKLALTINQSTVLYLLSFIIHLMIQFVSDLPHVGVFFFGYTPVSSTNKTDRHDIAEILMKVA